MSDELKVDDSEYESIVQICDTIKTAFEKRTTAYVTIMTELCDNGIKEGYVHNNLCSFVQTANIDLKQYGDIIDLLKSNYQTFLSDIDEKDGDIY